MFADAMGPIDCCTVPGTPSQCAANGYPPTHAGRPDLDRPTLTLTWQWLGSDTIIQTTAGGMECCLGLDGPRSTPVSGSTTVTLYRATGDTNLLGSLRYDSGVIPFPTGYPRGNHYLFDIVTGGTYYYLNPAWPPPYCRIWVGCYTGFGGGPTIRINARELSAAQAANTSLRPTGSTDTALSQFNAGSGTPFANLAVTSVLSTSPIHWRFRYDRGPLSGGPDAGAISYDIMDVTE